MSVRGGELVSVRGGELVSVGRDVSVRGGAGVTSVQGGGGEVASVRGVHARHMWVV